MKETSFSANSSMLIQHGFENRAAVEQLHSAALRLQKQRGCEAARQAWWPWGQAPLQPSGSAPRGSAPPVFPLQPGKQGTGSLVERVLPRAREEQAYIDRSPRPWSLIG